MAFLRRHAGRGWPAALGALAAAGIMLAGAGVTAGHVGNRLRLGYRAEPILSALARMTEIYLEEVSGFQIDLKEYGDPFALQAAISEQKVDVALEYPTEAWSRTACPEKGALVENIFPLMKSYYREKYGAVWVGMFTIRKLDMPACTPSFVISKGVAEDLSFYTLPDYLKKLMSAVTQADLEDILAKDPSGTDASILRACLSRKKMI